MKFSTVESKVMIIGKRLDKNKKWKLGNSMLIETNDYKYLAVYFSWSLLLPYHINCYLKENFARKFNYMIKLFGEHICMAPLIEYHLAMQCGTQYSGRQSLMDVLYGCHKLYPPID